jgi:imidazolonepropionase
MKVDLLIHSAAQVLTIAKSPQRGRNLGDLGIIPNGALAIEAGQIVTAGATPELRAAFEPRQLLDASGRVVLPGFVDPHTHAVWAGDRANEFEMRLAGATYMDIMNAGGGIMSTVRQTRAASVDELVGQTRSRLRRMLEHGSTTIEVKTGYGLDTAAELRLWEAIGRLQREGPWELVATFLGAHAVPAEYQGRAEAYVDLVVDEMLPAIAARRSQVSGPIFADVFCEEGAFTVVQSRRILQAAAQLGFGLKLHADEFVGLGGAAMAAALGAVSCDHVVFTPDADIHTLGASSTVAVGLPPTPFSLAQREYTPAAKFLDASAILAIATDCNPGTGWCESMQLVVALACRYMRLTPAQAIVAATANAAWALGLGERIGSLTPGRQADVLIMDVPDYRHIGYRFGTNLVKTVIKNGRIAIDR